MKPQWANLFVVLLIFLLPTNLFLTFGNDSAYVTGMLSDYLIGKIYLSEVVLWLYIGSIVLIKRSELVQWFSNISKRIILNRLSVFLLLLSAIGLLLRQFWTDHATIGLWNLFQWLEIILLGVALRFHISLNQKQFVKLLIIGLSSTILFQSAVGVSQYLQQKSVYGYSLLGEPSLTNSISLNRFTNTKGENLILPYGTTAHPNLLGGYLAVYGSLLIGFGYRFYKRINQILLSSVGLLAFTLVAITHSMTAMITFIIISLIAFALSYRRIRSQVAHKIHPSFWLVGVLSFYGIVAPLLLRVLNIFFSNSVSISRRIWLQEATEKLVFQNLLFGTGLSQFVTILTFFTENNDVWRFLQPVHSVPWLFLSETGLLGILIILLLWKMVNLPTKKYLLLTSIALLAPICFDHYLFSLQPGRWLWAVVAISWILFTKPINSYLSE